MPEGLAPARDQPTARIRHPSGSVSALALALGLLLVVVVVVVGGGGGGGRQPEFFSAQSFWNTALADDAPVDPASSALVAHLAAEAAAEQSAHNGPTINTAAFSVPIYRVGADQPTVTVTLEDHDPDAALSAAWKAVPIPPDAQPAGGTDSVMVVYQPSTDRMWEFWRMHHTAEGWRATWGGAMRNVSHNSGVFGPDAWPGAKDYWGTAATSLPLAGGVMTLDELKRGSIDHVLTLDLPDPRAGVYSWPAQRTDGQSSDPTSLPAGARLRIDRHLDLSTLHLPHMTLMMARAAQRYGMVIRDTSGVISFQAEDPTRTRTDPYDSRLGFFNGIDRRQLFASFPWDHLQVLRMQTRAGG